MTNVNADNSSDPLVKVPDAARDSGTQLIHPTQTALQKICGSSDILDRLVSRYDLPEEYVNEKKEVASVFDTLQESGEI